MSKKKEEKITLKYFVSKTPTQNPFSPLEYPALTYGQAASQSVAVSPLPYPKAQ